VDNLPLLITKTMCRDNLLLITNTMDNVHLITKSLQKNHPVPRLFPGVFTNRRNR